jgi:uncharacterized protein
MQDQTLILKTIEFVKKELADAEGGHDWFHIERVYKNALLIGKSEEVDIQVVALSALLHDIADAKFHDGDESVAPRVAREWLESQSKDTEMINHVIAIINNISFKGGKNLRTISTIELDVVQDADRLDAIGAIGIARTFNYGGFKNHKIYDPNIPVNLNMTKEEYKKSTAPTLNHFYEKLLLLKNLMNTESGKKIAKKRHDYMLAFLDQFYAEWNGEA